MPADVKTQGPGGRNAARIRWVIILAVAGLGVYLFLRSRKNKQAQSAADASNTSGTSNGTTPSVPTYSLSASGLYNGAYTPYTIVNTTPGNFTSTFPGAQGTPAVSTSNSNSVTGAGITNTTQTTTYQ
jgi:hypothetical protein